MSDTSKQYDQAAKHCRALFVKKMQDYGTAWRVLRTASLTDQIYIKAQRIRSIETKGVQKIADNIADEFTGIVNYAIMALIQIELGVSEKPVSENQLIAEKYDHYLAEAKALMMKKNHDYGEAWRSMRISSYTDLILMKIFRTKQIEDNQGKTLVSEGADANYFDMINYAVFALIRLVVEKLEN